MKFELEDVFFLATDAFLVGCISFIKIVGEQGDCCEEICAFKRPDIFEIQSFVFFKRIPDLIPVLA